MPTRQLSDGNDDGTTLGQSASDTIAFFGATPIVQPADNSLAAIPRGQPCGLVTTYSTTQSPSTVNTITSGERAMTVQTGTGFTMQPGFSATAGVSDIFYVNKPTSQAGLGVGNIRVSAANIVQVAFHNPSGGNITPTASEVYRIVGVRGLPYVTATLSPASVPADTTVEQQFTITPTAALPQGLPVGMLVQVSKPTTQAGLDIVNCRVVSNNVIGITFINVSAAPIVPTASEVYNIFALGGLDAVNNYMHYNMNVGTVGAIGAGTIVTGGSTALAGALATDVCMAVQKPTAQLTATNTAVPIPSNSIFTADTFTLTLGSIVTGGTPTAAEVYTIAALRLLPSAPLVVINQTLTPVSVAADTCAEQTFTVPGLVAGSCVWVNKPSFQAGLGISGVRVSAANTLAINFSNATNAAIVPASESYIIGSFQQVAPGAGNSVYQAASPAIERSTTLVSALRARLSSATGGLGLVATG